MSPPLRGKAGSGCGAAEPAESGSPQGWSPLAGGAARPAGAPPGWAGCVSGCPVRGRKLGKGAPPEGGGCGGPLVTAGHRPRAAGAARRGRGWVGCWLSCCPVRGRELCTGKGRNAAAAR